MYIQVAVNVPRVSNIFDYHLPPELEGKVFPGSLVAVPFSHQTVQGIAVGFVEIPQVMKTRPVLALLDPEPALTLDQLQFAKQLAEVTLSPLAACLQTMLPPGLGQQADTLYSLQSSPAQSSGDLFPLQEKILEKLAQRGSLRGRQLDSAFPRKNWKDAVRGLERRGFVLAQPVLPPPAVRPKMARMVQLAVPPEEIDRLAALPKSTPGLGRGQAGERRRRLLEFLKTEPWPVMATWVYAASGGNSTDLVRLAEMELVTLTEEEVWRDPLEQYEPVSQEPPQLTPDQEAAWLEVNRELNAASEGNMTLPLLLHGVTGSGKTEIYLRTIAETLAQGKQAILMVPEIALTPQTVRRVLARFPGRVGLVHSRLSPGERYDTWRRARAGLLPVIVGPRSALFTPLPNLGLIILDECHDDSYYQSEGQPFYHAADAALLYGRLCHALVMFGSATPPVSMLYRARRENWPVIRLPNRIMAHREAVERQMSRLGRSLPVELVPDEKMAMLPLPPIEVVDMRRELKEGNRSMFSRALMDCLDEVLKAGQQAILFLNRRGRATYVFCRACGYVLRCPRCDLTLTLHTGGSAVSKDTLVCHICNYSRRLPHTCPQCSSTAIRHFGAGTEKVESEVQRIFPQARTLRWDAETARQKGAHEIILSHFVNHRADILIGTQMLAKGLDLPLVTLVGVVLADVGLNFPDFRAPERTFQLLTQVAGRAGRSPLGGRVILQTFQPDSYAIQAARGHDYAAFYERELKERRSLEYPPFTRLVRFEARSLQSGEAEMAAKKLASRLQYRIEQSAAGESAGLIGPAPCFFSRVNGYYRWQVILRAPNPLLLLQEQDLPSDSRAVSFRVEIDPPDLL